MENTTIMSKESTFKLGKRKENTLVKKAMELLNEYDYDPTDEALRKIFTEWAKQKGWLVDLFNKSQFYNGNGQIVIPANLKRPIDKSGINRFIEWAAGAYKDEIAENEIMVGLFSLYEYRGMYNRVADIVSNMRCYLADDTDRCILYKGKSYAEWIAERNRMKRRIDDIKVPYSLLWSEKKQRNVLVEDKDYSKYDYFTRLLQRCLLEYGEEEPNIIGENRMEVVNELCEHIGLKARATKGQKVTKFIGKVLKELGLNHNVNIVKAQWVDNNTGEVHTREKDMGYNYYFALLGDSINPLEYTREVVISVNPIDYWTMSFGYKWASCHTIDKKNKRRVGHSDYQGCYSGGTESYMLDPSSIIVYIRPTEEEIKSINEEKLPMEMQSKFKRCVFFLGEDKLIQSRVYPDGRDGGDEGLSTQLRNIVQEVIAKLYDTPNMWTLKKGTYECGNMIHTVSFVHYEDYNHYDDCNVSYLKRINGNRNTKRIDVGADIICPTCGELHDSQEHITCDDCFAGTKCNNCGDSVDEDDCIFIDGNYYCCAECAVDAGYEFTVEGEWHDASDCYYDEYTNEYWYYEPSESVCVGEYWYACPENAESDGWMYSDIDDEWCAESDIYVDVHGNTFAMRYHDDAVETEDGWYLNPSEAEEDGWECVDDEWVRAA